MPNGKDVPYYQYLIKSSKWVIGNSFFGLLPLLFILFINAVSGGKTGNEEISRLIHDGVILFVCCAIMGAVLIDYILLGIKQKIALTIGLLIIPGFIVILLLTDYTLIILKEIDNSCFNLSSNTSKIVIGLTIIFSIFTKASIFIKEDSRHE